jgi:serine/threonine protein kinase
VVGARRPCEKEVDILKDLRFPNVVGYADSFSEGDAGASLCVVMEYAEEGTLEDVLSARKAAGPRPTTQCYWQLNLTSFRYSLVQLK